MWGTVLFCLVVGISSGFGQSLADSVQMENKTLSKTGFNDLTDTLKVESFLDEFADWASSAADYIREKSREQTSILQPAEDDVGFLEKGFSICALFLIIQFTQLTCVIPLTLAEWRQCQTASFLYTFLLGVVMVEWTSRRLKHKKAEMKFIMKTLILLKVILGLILPLGIIASKILSWKAVTLSLMAFMLAKILFIKNLLTGKNGLSVTPANFVPPVFIHGGPNDVFWKRQGDLQNVYPWSSS